MLGKLEQYIAGAWRDLSSRVPWLTSPVSVSRGLSEDGTPAVGTMAAVLENSDGALTPGAPSVEVRRNQTGAPRADASWTISYATGGTGTSSLVSDGRWRGGSARRAKVDTVPSSGDPYIQTSPSNLPVMAVGETWVIAFRYALSGGGTINNVWAGGSNAPVVTYGALQIIDHEDGTCTAWRTATCTGLGAGTGAFRAYISLKNAGLTTSTVFLGGDLLCEKADTFGGYFDGGYSADGALAPSWVGAANASASILTTMGADLVRWRPTRLNVWADGAWRPRFYGFVDTEPLSWPTGVAEYCVVTVTAVDLIARLAAGSLSHISANMVLATSPIAYWPLTDSGAPAANLSGVTYVDLVEGQIGEGGELEWGGGTKLPSDNSAGLMITAGAGSENGPFLRSGEFDLPAAWSLAINFTPSTAEPDGVLVELGDDQRYVRIWWDSTTRKCLAVLSVHDPAGYYEIQLSESTSAIPAGVVYRETLEFTGTHWRLGSASGPVAESTGLPSLVWVSVGGATDLTPTSALTGGVAHLAIWSGALPSLPVNLTPSAAHVQSWVQQLVDWAGVSATVATIGGANRGAVMPALDGQSAAAAIGALAQGSLGRIFADRDGGLAIVSWNHYPTPISPPAGEIDPGVEWMADPDGDPTMVTMTWPDGTIYRAIRSGERPVDLPGVLAVAAGQSAADWVARVGTAAIPRIGEATYDLVTLPEATRAALAGLDVGDRISIGQLPSQLPSSSQVAVVDAVSETIGADQWMLTFRTSPHGRDQVFSAGDATRGKVGAGYRAAPFDPAVEGPWKAGEEVTAARLNARAYVGGAVQAGRVTITPVANADTSLAVTFPSAFASTPRVVVTADTPAPESEVKSVTISNVTTSGFTLWVLRTNATATPVDWLAVP